MISQVSVIRTGRRRCDKIAETSWICHSVLCTAAKEAMSAVTLSNPWQSKRYRCRLCARETGTRDSDYVKIFG